MNFLLGVLVGGLLVCLPLVVIVLTARRNGDELETITLAEMQLLAIKRDTVREMFRAVDDSRVRSGVGNQVDRRFDGSVDVD